MEVGDYVETWIDDVVGLGCCVITRHGYVQRGVKLVYLLFLDDFFDPGDDGVCWVFLGPWFRADWEH